MASNPGTPIWLTVEDAIDIHDDQLARFGGLVGIKSMDLLESAMASPLNHWTYGREYSVIRLGAHLANAIVRDHPFLDGNKRTAAMAFLEFLYLNGLAIEIEDSEKRQPFAELVEQLASRTISPEQFAEILRPYMVEV